MSKKTVLVTGGLGYIGSHFVSKLKNSLIVIVDNLENSDIAVLSILKEFAKLNNSEIVFYKADIRDLVDLEAIFKTHNPGDIIHFAALKSPYYSNLNKDLYYKVNVDGTKNLIHLAEKYGIDRFIYSSSATVYGDNNGKLSEDAQVGNNIMSYYGTTKYLTELELRKSNIPNIIILRYFNPIGCHSLGILLENPRHKKHANIIPKLLDAYDNQKVFQIFGDKYDTPDGTCIRDYIHVEDLADAHILALDVIGKRVYNVGTGKGTSVKELVKIFEKYFPIKYEIGEKLNCDVGYLVADVSRITNELGFKPKFTVKDAIKHISLARDLLDLYKHTHSSKAISFSEFYFVEETDDDMDEDMEE